MAAITIREPHNLRDLRAAGVLAGGVGLGMVAVFAFPANGVPLWTVPAAGLSYVAWRVVRLVNRRPKPMPAPVRPSVALACAAEAPGPRPALFLTREQRAQLVAAWIESPGRAREIEDQLTAAGYRWDPVRPEEIGVTR